MMVYLTDTKGSVGRPAGDVRRPPLVASNVGGLREIITHRENGLLVTMRRRSRRQCAN